MKIALGCDHGGLELKGVILEHLKKQGYEVIGVYLCMHDAHPEAFENAKEGSELNETN